MKYIYRYALITTFPNPDNTITQDQLQQALRSVNFQFNKYDIPYLIKLSISSIQRLFNKPQQKFNNIIQHVFISTEHAVPIPEVNIKQLQTVWEQQKVNIYKFIIDNSTTSSLTYNGLKWSVRNSIMRRNNLKKQENTITKFTLNCFENTKEQSAKDKVNKMDLIVTVNKQSLPNFIQSFTDCQTAINEILMSE